MQPLIFEYFSSNHHHSFLEDCSITLIDKTDHIRREEYWKRVLKTVTRYFISSICCLCLQVSYSVVILLLLLFYYYHYYYYYYGQYSNIVINIIVIIIISVQDSVAQVCFNFFFFFYSGVILALCAQCLRNFAFLHVC